MGEQGTWERWGAEDTGRAGFRKAPASGRARTPDVRAVKSPFFLLDIYARAWRYTEPRIKLDNELMLITACIYGQFDVSKATMHKVTGAWYLPSTSHVLMSAWSCMDVSLESIHIRDVSIF